MMGAGLIRGKDRRAKDGRAPAARRAERRAARGERRASVNGVSASVAALLALTALAMGMAGGFLITRAQVPPSLVSTTRARTVDVAASPFDDVRSITLTVTLGESSTLVSPVSGTVTGVRVAAGEPLASGGVAFDVDAMPVPALHTDVPPYRTLTPGAQGPDAAGLNVALRRLGYAAPDADVFGWDTIAAYNAFAQAVGARPVTQDDGWTLGTGRFVWLPAESVTVGDIHVTVGRQVAAGADLLVTAAMPLKATLPASEGSMSSAGASSSSGPVPGERTLTIGGQEFAVPADAAELTDPALLAAIDGSVAFRMALLDGGSAGGGLDAGTPGMTGLSGGTVNVTYDWRLARPLTALAVPPSALYGLSGDAGCVSVDGEPVPVTVIASRLGRTMVAVDGDGHGNGDTVAFDHVDVTPSATAPCVASDAADVASGASGATDASDAVTESQGGE